MRQALDGQEFPLDLDYGDSDVYFLQQNGKPLAVRKRYQPGRMIHNLDWFLGEGLDQIIAFKINPDAAAHLALLREADLENKLPAILDRYRQDTLDIMNDVEAHPEVYEQKPGELGVSKLSFCVVPQGERVSATVVDGQALIQGENLWQLMDPESGMYRSTMDVSAQKAVPAFFRDPLFVNRALSGFVHKATHRFIERSGSDQFAIFHRLHPANTIAHRQEDGSWKIHVTDLSTNLCLDYALLMKEI